MKSNERKENRQSKQQKIFWVRMTEACRDDYNQCREAWV